VKLVIVSNRLPLSTREEEGRLHFTESPGGLASGLRTYLGSAHPAAGGYVWVGWPGGPVRPEVQPELAARCRQEFHARPVFLSQADTEAFYEGFCNQTLWPLLHTFPERVAYDEDSWAVYERVNALFCDAALEEIETGDLVWVHDYHFLLLPALLRQKRPGLRVGFFLHTPFPSFEVFRLLPDRWRRALLEGLLGADLVGFHTHDYAQHFLKSVRRLLGREQQLGWVALADRWAKADTFPMGVAFDAFDAPPGGPAAAQREDFRAALAGRTAVLSIDRLDYTKGIANRLLAYRAFLEANPGWHSRVVLFMVVVPSRTGVGDYQQMKARIDGLVGEVNGRFGTLDWTPVVYQYRSLPQQELVPLYQASDVMLVTPLRDGMNLVAKEYVAARQDGKGVLVLSEMAGAASEMGEALVVNPNDVAGMAAALREALEMPAAEQGRRMAALRDRVRRYDVVRWAGEFLEALGQEQPREDRRLLTAAVRAEVVAAFRSAGRRLLLLDYDGTLVPIRPTPEQARPDAALPGLLARLAGRAEVVVVSGRPRDFLEGCFGALDVSLVAEHGAWVKPRGHAWQSPPGISTAWKGAVRELMERYVGRLPGSFVEEKEHTLAWHYRRSDPDLAALRARELADHLHALAGTGDLKVVEGHKVVEARPAGTGKGAACLRWLGGENDFVLAVGDDTTDEDLFRVLPETAWSVRVGLTRSHARFHVAAQSEARALLAALAETR
jgi:trehalose 6-phosphate synthase/phosphatase